MEATQHVGRRPEGRRHGLDGLARQHQELHLTLRRTERAIAELGDGQRSGSIDRAAIQRALRSLEDLERDLPAHFHREEANGYMAEVLQVAPRFSERAESLCAQHPSLASELRGIVALARRAGSAGSGPRWIEVERRFRLLHALVQMHERAENEIASQALLEDIGSSG